jgi:hypothetical protein
VVPDERREASEVLLRKRVKGFGFRVWIEKSRDERSACHLGRESSMDTMTSPTATWPENAAAAPCGEEEEAATGGQRVVGVWEEPKVQNPLPWVKSRVL